MISLDGLRPDFYLDRSFGANTLLRLRETGAYCRGVEPVYPALTYPNHTTLVTGVLPAEHGIISNLRFSAETGPLRDWYWEEAWIRVPTLWQLATQRGQKVALFRWPATMGARCEWVDPEWFSPEHEAVFSRGEQDRQVALAASRLIRENSPDLLLVHLIDVDHAQHERGRDSPLLGESLQAADRALGHIVDSLDLTQTRLMVVGDHGFTNFTQLFRINRFLQDEGWLALTGAWRAVAHVDGGIAAIYVRDPIDQERVLRTLEKFQGRAFQILGQEKLRELGAFPGAACSLDPLQGISLKGGDGPLWERLDQTHGRHGNNQDPEMLAGALFAGPGISPGDHGFLKMQELAERAANWIDLEFPDKGRSSS